MAYRIVAHHPNNFRVSVEYESPDRAIEIFEKAGRRALEIVGARVQLFDGDRLISEFVGPEPRPVGDLTAVIDALDEDLVEAARPPARRGLIIALIIGLAMWAGIVAAFAGEKPLHVAITTIDDSKQRYPTAGDWQVDKAGNLRITVSRMSDRRYEFLVAMHETVEAFLCQRAGITQRAADKFDMDYEKHRKPGDTSEPGDDPRAPYHEEHVLATKIEMVLANALGVDWRAYDKEVSSK